MQIEIMHVRDYDGECTHVVFVDGVEVQAHFEDLDPGRGHQLSDWDDHTKAVAENPNTSQAFRDTVVANRNELRDDRYIENDNPGED